jgi:hypothetical protein
MTAIDQPNNHFYASSIATWATTTDTRDLRDLIKIMERDGFDYSLWFIPHPHDTHYEIKFYQPQIEGAMWVGHFKISKKKGRKV